MAGAQPTAYICTVPRSLPLQLLPQVQPVECQEWMLSPTTASGVSRMSKTFQTNLPQHFLEFDIDPTLVNQLMNLSLTPSTKLSDVRTLYTRLCTLLHQDPQCLLFRPDCVAPDWYKRHPQLVGQIYAKLWHPLLVVRLVVLQRPPGLIKYAVQHGAYFPSYVYDKVLPLVGYIPEQIKDEYHVYNFMSL